MNISELEKRRKKKKVQSSSEGTIPSQKSESDPLSCEASGTQIRAASSLMWLEGAEGRIHVRSFTTCSLSVSLAAYTICV